MYFGSGGIDEVGNTPRAALDASGHCWRTADGGMRFHEVVIGQMQPDGSLEVFQLLGERQREASKALAVWARKQLIAAANSDNRSA